MPKTSLGIQLTPSEALVVRLKSGWRGIVVDKVIRVERGFPDDRLYQPEGLALPPAEVSVAALAADQVFQRQVELPFRDRRRVERAAPLEAEESLPLPLEGLVCDVQILSRETGKSRALVAAAPLERMSALLGELSALGTEPQVVDVEPLALATIARRCVSGAETALLLDASVSLCQAVVVQRGTPTAFHAFSVQGTDPELLNEVSLYLSSLESEGLSPEAVYLSGPQALIIDPSAWSETLARRVALLPKPRRGIQVSRGVEISWPLWAVPLGLALRGLASRTASKINLLRGPFGPDRDASHGRRVLVLAGVYGALLLALWGASVWAESSFRQKQYESLRASVRQRFQQTLPDVRNIVSEVDQLKAKVTELEERDRSLAGVLEQHLSPLLVLKELSSKLPRDTEVEFRDLVVDPSRVTIEGTTNSYRSSEKIKADIIAADPRFTSVKSEAKDGVKPGEVIFTLTIDLGDKG